MLSTATPVGPAVGQVAGGVGPVTTPVHSEAKTTVGVPVDISIKVTSFEPVLATTASPVEVSMATAEDFVPGKDTTVLVIVEMEEAGGL
jgi:hypothetical protein